MVPAYTSRQAPATDGSADRKLRTADSEHQQVIMTWLWRVDDVNTCRVKPCTQPASSCSSIVSAMDVI